MYRIYTSFIIFLFCRIWNTPCLNAEDYLYSSWDNKIYHFIFSINLISWVSNSSIWPRENVWHKEHPLSGSLSPTQIPPIFFQITDTNITILSPCCFPLKAASIRTKCMCFSHWYIHEAIVFQRKFEWMAIVYIF